MARSGFAASNCLRLASAVLTAAPISIHAHFYSGTLATGDIVGLLNSASSAEDNTFKLRLLVTGQLLASTGVVGGSSSAATTAGTVSANTWYRGLAVFAAANSRSIYLNGANKVTDTVSRTPSGINRTSIGLRDNTSNDRPATGPVAEVAIWNVGLTDAEALVLNAGADAREVRSASLVGYWQLYGRNSPEINLMDNGAGMSIIGSLSAADHPRVSRARRTRVNFSPAVVAGISYPQLERGIRGVGRGVAMGSYR